MYFASIRLGKAYVSFHFMPLGQLERPTAAGVAFWKEKNWL
jgi:hypothetical protein